MLIKIIVIMAILVVVTIILCSWYLANKVLHPKRVCIDKSIHIERKYGRFNEEEYSNYSKDNIRIKSNYGYDLDTIIIYRDKIDKDKIIKNKEKVIIFVHGFEYNKIGSIKYFDIFRSRNYNIVMFDHRNSGNSGGNTTTMGYLEKYDLKVIIDEVKKIFGEHSTIGIHGESMGASTALLLLEIEDEIDFIIADCGYSNLKEELRYQLKLQYKLPPTPFLNIASIITKLKVGYKYEDIMPIECARKYGQNIPILFIHGENDNFTPCNMSKEMYQLRKESVSKNICTMLYIARDSDHTESYWNNKEEYNSVIETFLKNVD